MYIGNNIIVLLFISDTDKPVSTDSVIAGRPAYTLAEALYVNITCIKEKKCFGTLAYLQNKINIWDKSLEHNCALTVPSLFTLFISFLFQYGRRY